MTLSVGDNLIDFTLKNANTNIGGNEVNAVKFSQENGLVVVFECNHCPYVVASGLGHTQHRSGQWPRPCCCTL